MSYLDILFGKAFEAVATELLKIILENINIQ